MMKNEEKVCPECKGVLHHRQERLECDACSWWIGFIDWGEEEEDAHE